jgi:ABC-2 type transport system ATP-binding protein
MRRITIEKAEKSYRNIHVLKGLSLKINENEIFGIVGPNGAGKTTLIESILGLRHLDSGSISVFGLDSNRDHKKLVRVMGAQLQQSELAANIKVKEALELQAGLFGCKVDIREKLEKFDLAEKGNNYFSKLSGGQKQRLFILLASIHDPEILFFDEQSNGLDHISRQEAWKKVLKLKEQGKTVVISTHLMEEAEYLCDRVALINYGEVVNIGTVGELVGTLPFSVVLSVESSASLEEIRKVLKEREGIYAVNSNGAKQFSILGTDKMDVQQFRNVSAGSEPFFQSVKFRDSNLEDYFSYMVEQTKKGKTEC